MISSFLRRVWTELTRPRGSVRHRFYRGGRRTQSGVALLLVITSILFMTIIVTEIAYAATVRVQLAAHQRDETKAEAIALTGIQIYRLVLVASKQLGSAIGPYLEMFGMTGDALWQMMPMINTGLLRMIFVSGGDVESDDIQEIENAGGLTEEQIDESRESRAATKRNFLDFDGDFFAEIRDEDSRIFVGDIQAASFPELMENRHALELYSLLTGQGYDNDEFFRANNLDKWELLGNLADWTDTDTTRVVLGGQEESLYNNMERDPYLPKNAPFDSLLELRLVEGWHRDDVWDKFGDKLTIYGGGKVNVNTAPREVMVALFKAHIDPTPSDYDVDRLMDNYEEYKALASFSNANAFMSWIQGQGVTVDSSMATSVTTESTVFRITSVGQVNDATVTIETVFDFTTNPSGQVVYWRVQ